MLVNIRKGAGKSVVDQVPCPLDLKRPKYDQLKFCIATVLLPRPTPLNRLKGEETYMYVKVITCHYVAEWWKLCSESAFRTWIISSRFDTQRADRDHPHEQIGTFQCQNAALKFDLISLCDIANCATCDVLFESGGTFEMHACAEELVPNLWAHLSSGVEHLVNFDRTDRKDPQKAAAGIWCLSLKNIVLESQNVIFLESEGTLITFQTISERDNKKCEKKTRILSEPLLWAWQYLRHKAFCWQWVSYPKEPANLFMVRASVLSKNIIWLLWLASWRQRHTLTGCSWNKRRLLERTSPIRFLISWALNQNGAEQFLLSVQPANWPRQHDPVDTRLAALRSFCEWIFSTAGKHPSIFSKRRSERAAGRRHNVRQPCGSVGNASRHVNSPAVQASALLSRADRSRCRFSCPASVYRVSLPSGDLSGPRSVSTSQVTGFRRVRVQHCFALDFGCYKPGPIRRAVLPPEVSTDCDDLARLCSARLHLGIFRVLRRYIPLGGWTLATSDWFLLRRHSAYYFYFLYQDLPPITSSAGSSPSSHSSAATSG